MSYAWLSTTTDTSSSFVGGWAPYFLTRQQFDHCGSIDIDLVLKPSIMPRYQSIKDVVEGLGYTVTMNPFRFSRDLTTLSGSRGFTIYLDLLTEPEPALSQEFLVEVQEDLRACLIPGISIVFNHYYEQELEATLLAGGGEACLPLHSWIHRGIRLFSVERRSNLH